MKRRVNTKIRVNAVPVTVGANTNIYAYLTRPDTGYGIPDAQIEFFIISQSIGNEITKTSSGVAVKQFYVGNEMIGKYTIYAEFKGDSQFYNSTGSNTMTVSKGNCGFSGPTSPQNATLNKSVKYTIYLTNVSGKAIPNRDISVTVDNAAQPWKRTDSKGAVVFEYTFRERGIHIVKLEFAGDTYFNRANPYVLQVSIK